MNSAARSLTDWPGFMNSALPRMVQPVCSDACLSLISGVLPMAWTIPSRICMSIVDLGAQAGVKGSGFGANLPGKPPGHKFELCTAQRGKHISLSPSFFTMGRGLG